MNVAKVIALGLLGVIAGMVAGGLIGLGGGLAWTTLSHTSSFEGYSGFVAAYWMLAGIILGGLAGLILGVRLAVRASRPG